MRSFDKPEYEFAILGAGALGSILGAHLVRAGHSVAMIARGRRAEQVRNDGLRITGLSDFSTPVRVLHDPSELRSAGVLIVAMKTPGTAEALAKLSHADIEMALSIQNGPLKNELLTQTYGSQRVLGALANTSGEMLTSGEIFFTRNVNILLGELSGEASARARLVAGAIDATGIRATAVAGIRSLEWSKFVSWVGLMALAVTTRALTWRYLSDPGTALVLVRVVREMGHLAHALHIQLTDESVLPSATLCRGTEEAAVEVVTKMGRDFALHAPHHRLSTLQDLEAGRPLEIHETLGYALRKAAQHHVHLPLTDTFYHIIAAIDRMRADAKGS